MIMVKPVLEHGGHSLKCPPFCLPGAVVISDDAISSGSCRYICLRRISLITQLDLTSLAGKCSRFHLRPIDLKRSRICLPQLVTIADVVGYDCEISGCADVPGCAGSRVYAAGVQRSYL
jgi:hypothetical protein